MTCIVYPLSSFLSTCASNLLECVSVRSRCQLWYHLQVFNIFICSAQAQLARVHVQAKLQCCGTDWLVKPHKAMLNSIPSRHHAIIDRLTDAKRASAQGEKESIALRWLTAMFHHTWPWVGQKKTGI